MPIYEYYCPDNNKIYQFFAKTLSQGARVPRCPDNPSFSMEKIVSSFAVSSSRKSGTAQMDDAPKQGGNSDDPRMDAALGAMEREFSHIDENDPKAMGRMMRRLSELSGERIDGEMEEVVRKLEEGTDPEKLEEQLGTESDEAEADSDSGMGDENARAHRPGDVETERRQRYKARRSSPVRDPRLYDYD